LKNERYCIRILGFLRKFHGAETPVTRGTGCLDAMKDFYGTSAPMPGAPKKIPNR
jgi:hypothetical protein